MIPQTIDLPIVRKKEKASDPIGCHGPTVAHSRYWGSALQPPYGTLTYLVTNFRFRIVVTAGPQGCGPVFFFQPRFTVVAL